MLSISSLDLNIEGDNLISDLSLGVNPGEVVVLAGENGAGKSTVFRSIMGIHNDHSGNLVVQKGVKTVWMTQELPDYEGSVFAFILRRKKELHSCWKKTEENGPETPEYGLAISEFYRLGGDKAEGSILEYLREFGFDEDNISQSFNNFSKGQQRIFDLVSLMLEAPDLMLLDEPTNHLDISMRLFLENFILTQADKGKGFLVITHDRAMMDRIADRTVYIKRKRPITISGGYTDLISHLEMDFAAKEKKAEVISSKIKKLEKDALKKRSWAGELEKRMSGARNKPYLGVQFKKMMGRAKHTENKIQQESNRLKEEKPWVEKKINLNFPEYDVVQKDLLFMEAVTISYSQEVVIKDFNFSMKSLDRKALAGSNGSGKTTLLRTAMGLHKEYSGSMRFNDSVEYLYIPQKIHDFFSGAPIETDFKELDLPITDIRTHLGCAKLDSEVIFREPAKLSYGELMRVALVKAILSRKDFLILDEPTNHLDIESLEILDALLAMFPGGYLAVSHDRHFLAGNFDEVVYLD